MTDESFTCPACGRTSHHPEDLKHGYCGACHAFTGLPDGLSLAINTTGEDERLIDPTGEGR